MESEKRALQKIANKRGVSMSHCIRELINIIIEIAKENNLTNTFVMKKMIKEILGNGKYGKE